MKAKVYPINVHSDYVEAPASSFCLHIQIICASLARGTSTIKNIIESEQIHKTISICQSLGAVIKKSNDRYVIKGVNNVIKYNDSVFNVLNSDITGMMMIPILCTTAQPFGVLMSPELLQTIEKYQYVFEELGVNVFPPKDQIIRFEKSIHKCEVEIDGDVDIALFAGILMAFGLLNKDATIKLRAPIPYQQNYKTIINILKHFSIDVKHKSSMRYDLSRKKKYKSTYITTETDKLIMSHLSLLTLKLESNTWLKVKHYKKGSTLNEREIFDFIQKYAINFSQYFYPIKMKRKVNAFTFENTAIELNVENSLPFLMVMGSLNKYDTCILKVNLNDAKTKKQYDIMAKIFAKLNILYTYESEKTQLIIHPSIVSEKKQIDCENNPYVAMAICILALLSKVPIIIKNAQCVYKISLNFFKRLTEYGAEIEFINN